MSIEQIPPSNPAPDWIIEELYRKAWSIVKKNKILWVFAAAAGGGMSFNNSFNFRGNEFEGLQKFFDNSTIPSANEVDVLGTATSSASGLFSYLLSAIPFWFYIILAFELIILFLTGIIITLVYQAWAQGTLLEGIQACISDRKVEIKESSENAFKYIKSLMFLQIVPGFLITLAFAAGIVTAFFLLIAIDGTLKILFGLLIFLLIVAAFFAFLMLSMTLIWAPRIVVVEKKSAIDAFKSAFRITRRKFWSSLLLGIINNIISGLVILLPVIVFLVLIVAGIFIAKEIVQFRLVFIILGVLLVFAFVLFLTLGGAIINSFKAIVWSLAYDKIKGKYDK